MAAAHATSGSLIPDEELVAQVVQGDGAAFQILYDRYFGRVYAFVQRRLRNRADVEETVQEVFINVFSSIGSYRGEAPLLILRGYSRVSSDICIDASSEPISSGRAVYRARLAGPR